MGDYISREDAIKAMLTRYWDGKETLREIMNGVRLAHGRGADRMMGGR